MAANTTTILTPEELLEMADRITEATGLTTEDRLFMLRKILDTIRRRKGLVPLTRLICMTHLKTLIRCYEHMQDFEGEDYDGERARNNDFDITQDA